MTDKDLQRTIVAGYRAVQHMASKAAKIAESMVKIQSPENKNFKLSKERVFMEVQLPNLNAIMQFLGDWLSNADSVTEEDETATDEAFRLMEQAMADCHPELLGGTGRKIEASGN